MALSKEQLTVQVELDSSGAVKGFTVLNEQLKKSATSSEKFENALKNLDDALETLGLALGSLVVSISIFNTKAIPRLISSLQETKVSSQVAANSLGLVTKSLNDFSKTITNAGINTLSSELRVLNTTVAQSQGVWNNYTSSVSNSLNKVSISYSNLKASNSAFHYSIKENQKELTNLVKNVDQNMDRIVQLSNANRDLFVSYVRQNKNMVSIATKSLQEVTSATGKFGKDVLSTISNINISAPFIAFSNTVKAAFSEGSLLKAIDIFTDSLSGVIKSVKTFGRIGSDFLQDLSNSTDILASALNAIPAIGKDIFSAFKTLLSTHIGGTFINIAESSLLLKGGLVALGTTLLTTDSAFGKFIGTLSLVAGVALGGLAFAIQAALGFIGNFISAIGTKLIDSMNMMEQKFQKAEVAITNFNYTIAGMNREFGNSAGTLQSWTKIVDELSNSTLISATDARKMATEIMAVGHGLGMTQQQMEDLIKLIPNYIKAGDDAFAVTVSFLQALGGAPQGLLKYAVHLSDAGVEHSKFAKSSNLVMSALTEEQKVQARFNALMEQSSPILGRATLQLSTVAGAYQFLDNSLTSIQEKIGKQSFLVQKMYLAFAALGNQLVKLPDAFWYMVGVAQDLSAVLFKIVGTIIAFALPISALASSFVILNSIVNANATAQFLLTKALTFTNVALGGQAIAVTSASALWAGLGAVLKSVVITALTSVQAAIVGTVKAIYAISAAILTSPLFWKAAAIVAGIYLMVKALQRIEEETKIFSSALKAIQAPFEQLIQYFKQGSKSGNEFANTFGVVLAKSIDVAVIAISAVLNGIYTLIFAVNKLVETFTVGDFSAAFKKSGDEAYRTMESLTATMGRATSNLFNFNNTAQASQAGLDNLSLGAKQARDALAGLNKEYITANEKALILAQTQGNQAKALVLSKAIAQEKMALAKDFKEKQQLAKEIFQIDAQLAQFPVESLKDSASTYNQLKISNLEQLNTLASIRQAGALKVKEALAPLYEKVKQLSFLPATEKTKKALEQLRAVISSTQSAINSDTEKKVFELANARLQAEFTAREQIARLMGDSAALAQVTYEREVLDYQKMLNEKLISAEQFQAAEKKLREKRDTATGAGTDKPTPQGMDVGLVTDMMSSAASGADAVVGNAITQLGKAFGPEGQIIAGAINLLRMGGEAMKELGQGLIKVLIELPLQIAEGVVGLVEGLLQGVIDMLADPARLAKIITSLTNMVPKLITALARAIPKLLQLLLDPAFWIELSSQIIRSLWDAFVEMLSAIGDMLGSIFSGDIFGGLEESTEEMGKTVNAGIRYATNALTGVSDQMFGVMEDTAAQAQKGAAGAAGGGGGQAAKKKEASWFTKYIVEPLARVVNFLWEGLSGIGEYIWGVIEPVIGTIGTTLVAAIKIAIEIFSTAFDIIWTIAKTVWNTMVAYLKGTWNVMMSVFKSVWNVGVSLLKGVINIFKTVFEAIANVLRGVWEFAKSIFDVIINTFQALWDFVKGIFDDPIAAFQKLWDDLKNIVSDLWDSITELGTVLWDAIKSIGKAIWDALAKVGEAMWEGLKAIGSKIWDMFKGVGGAIWEGTKDIGKRIGESLSNVGDYLWDGIKGAFSGIKNFFKGLFSFDGGGTGAVEKFLNFDFPWIAFAEGGKVPGTPNVFGDSTKNDTVAALLSPGEFVIPRSKMQDPDNLMLVDMIMSGGAMKEWILNGATEGVQAKSYGSWIEKAQSGGIEFHSVLSDLVDAVTPQWILDLWDSIKKFVSNISLKDLISDPIGAIKKAIKGTLDFLIEPFKKMMSFNTGGMVPGFGNTDTVPAMLTPGEFVINKGAAQNLGAGLLNQLNAGMMPQMAGAGQAPVFNINLNIETSEAIDDNYIRTRLIPTIKQEIRSSSLRGEFLVSSKGIR